MTEGFYYDVIHLKIAAKTQFEEIDLHFRSLHKETLFNHTAFDWHLSSKNKEL